MTIELGNTVILEYIGRIVSDDGDDDIVFDTSRESVAEEAGLAQFQSEQEHSPLTAEIGSGELLEGLKEALIGREQGETFTITIPPEKAHGKWTEEQVREYDVEELKEMIGGYDPVEGANVETKTGRRVEIVDIEDGVAHVDFNHPLSDKTLEFDIEILDVE